MTLESGSVVTPNMVLGEVKQSQDFLSVNLNSTAQIPSFLENNADLIDKITETEAMEQEMRNLQLVYHSMPLSCF